MIEFFFTPIVDLFSQRLFILVENMSNDGLLYILFLRLSIDE